MKIYVHASTGSDYIQFIPGRFYAHDTSEYEYSDGSIEYLYCKSVRNMNEKYPNAEPFYEAILVDTDGEGHSIAVNEDGTPIAVYTKNINRFYREISKSEYNSATRM